MTYSAIYNIFNLMQDTQKAIDSISELRLNLKKQGKYTEMEGLIEAEVKMSRAILNYHELIARYVISNTAFVDNFDDEFEAFLEDNIYNLDDCGYNSEETEGVKKELRRSFIKNIWSSVIDDDFYNEDEKIQAFINGFDKLDLYLYILSK